MAKKVGLCTLPFVAVALSGALVSANLQADAVCSAVVRPGAARERHGHFRGQSRSISDSMQIMSGTSELLASMIDPIHSVCFACFCSCFIVLD